MFQIAVELLGFLFDFLDQEMGMEMKETQKLNSSGFTEFRHLWTIFKLGELILQGGKNPRLGRLGKTKFWQDQTGKYLAVEYIYFTQTMTTITLVGHH